MDDDSTKFNLLPYSNAQLTILVVLRVAIGWHIFYEGLTKLLNPNWSSVGYLLDSKGIFADFFYFLASDPGILKVVDFLNVWGLLIIGLCLIIGLFEKFASIGGILLLGLYYFSHPPFIGLDFEAPGEGSYLLVNKNLIEVLAIGINLYFPNSRLIGIDRLLYKMRNKK